VTVPEETETRFPVLLPLSDPDGTDIHTVPTSSEPVVIDITPETSFVPVPGGSPSSALSAPVCASGTTPEELTAFFDLGDPLIGADYQRAFPLPDGRVLWLFQDAVLPTAHGPELVHNVGLLQSGRCFQLLRSGSADAPAPYLLGELTDRYHRWFWALGGDIGRDGRLHVFVAEFRERGDRYLTHSEPVATWLVTIAVDDLRVVDTRAAPDGSSELYGWSVVSHGDHTYLYAHCYRQYGWDFFPFSTFRAHDFECGPNVTVARIPRGEFGATPEYWNGTEWGHDPTSAVPVIPTEGRAINPTQVAVFEGRFVAVTKEGDWWGTTIELDVAPAPEGPWTTYDELTVDSEGDRFNNYFASFVPYGADDSSFVVGLSCNTSEGDDLAHYSPIFFRVPAPS
jgi:hypothetical protein